MACDRVLARSRRIVSDNLAVLDDLFRRRADRLSWIHPRGGSIAFPDLDATPIDDFAARLVEEGVLLLPGSQFGHPGNHFRIGFGRENLQEAVTRLEAYLDRSTPLGHQDQHVRDATEQPGRDGQQGDGRGEPCRGRPPPSRGREDNDDRAEEQDESGLGHGQQGESVGDEALGTSGSPRRSRHGGRSSP